MAFAAVIPMTKAAIAITTPAFNRTVGRDMGVSFLDRCQEQEVSALRA
jgi:hypothetical protein